MKKSAGKIELLAPAGSPESLRSAVLNGADAVYLGYSEFSARSSAVNFSDEELTQAVRFCHLRGVKVFLAVNIMLFEDELERLARLAELACRIGIDGFIVSDLGAAALLRLCAPQIPMHASTQMTVHSLEGVRLMEDEGFERVVLSRELSAGEIEYINAHSNIETEVFVHGALCMSYSGKCLMSSMIGRRSGNRGKCAQPCRMQYTMDGRKGYLLSLRDLCLADDVTALVKSGVASLKIEGRMKSPEYVAVVTSIYRKAIDAGNITAEDRRALEDIFCRGDSFTRGFYGGEKADTILNTRLSNDETGKKAPQELLKKAAASYREGADIKKRAVRIELTVNKEDAQLVFSSDGATALVSSVMTAATPLDASRLREQLSKTGGTPFYVNEISVNGDVRLRISEVNELRRRALLLLSEKLSQPKAAKSVPFIYNPELFEKSGGTELVPYVSDIEQARVFMNKAEKLYVPLHILNELDRTDGVSAVLPVIIKKDERERVAKDLDRAAKRGVKYAVCHSLDALAAAKEANMRITAGAGLNIANSLSVSEALRLGAERIMLSPELSLGGIKQLSERTAADIDALIYGRLPLMITETCVMSGKKCGECRAVLKDRTGAEFPVRRAGYACRDIIFNSRPVYIADKGFDGYGIKNGILFFTVEDPRECEKIFENYKNKVAPSGEFTRGYLAGGRA